MSWRGFENFFSELEPGFTAINLAFCLEMRLSLDLCFWTRSHLFQFSPSLSLSSMYICCATHHDGRDIYLDPFNPSDSHLERLQRIELAGLLPASGGRCSVALVGRGRRLKYQE